MACHFWKRNFKKKVTMAQKSGYDLPYVFFFILSQRGKLLQNIPIRIWWHYMCRNQLQASTDTIVFFCEKEMFDKKLTLEKSHVCPIKCDQMIRN